MNKKKLPLHWKIFIALALSVITAIVLKVAGYYPSTVSGYLVSVCDFIGTLFMNALTLIVVPIIVTSIISGMFSIGDQPGGVLKRLGFKTVLYYMTTSLIAIAIGLSLVNWIQPGIVDPETAQAIIGQTTPPDAFLEKVEGRSSADLIQIFERMVPPNFFEILSKNNQLLGIIVVALFIGFFLNRITPEHRQVQKSFWNGLLEAIIMLTDLILLAAPYGVYALVTPILLRTGVELIGPLIWFFITVILALAIHLFVVMPLVLYLVGRVNPLDHFKAMEKALITAFSTSSSAATLPITLDTLQKEAKVSNTVSSFTIPLGATINMDGTALYETVVVLFIAQFYSLSTGFEMTFSMQISVAILALLTSVGVAGIPSASLVAITLILSSLGLPLESIGLVIAVDRILDMCRTAVNVFGDSVGAVVIARTEGEAIYES
jgi:Na+/H+-dicarboxylate symporter